MDSLESKRPPSPDSLNNKEETELLIRSKLKEIMMSVNIDEVTSKYIRQRLEEDIKMDLFKYKSFIDQEMLTILGQMDAANEIFPHVYLGSEWNASNLEELKNNGVGFILNVTKEIDNFFPGMFDYLNIRVYDDEKTELLRHWDDTYKYINQVKDKGSKVLVHCKMGISRSASVVIAYAMKAHNLSLEDAIKLVKNKRTCIKPNQAFTSQLKIYQGILDASRQRHNALFRSKSETNLKSSSGPSSHNSNMRLSYVPRGMQIFPIPDFRPRSCASVGGTVERGESEVTETCRTTTHQNNSENQPGSVTLRVPSPIQGRRPRSWSPDEDSTRNLSLHPYNDSEFGESLQKSRSLNDQAWHAHVTVVQRDLRDPGGGSVGLIEAVNPLYIPEKTSQSNQRIEDLQLSSSVKERINEFESAKNGVGGGTSSKCSGGKGPLTITLDQVTTTSSSTDDVEECVADTLVIFPPQITHSSTLGEAREDVDLLTSSISVNEEDVHNIRETPEDPPLVTWPTSGIVRKQKEDFEEKVKLQKDAKPRDQETILKQDCSHTENILRRQNSSQSLSAVENVKVIISPDGAMETIKKDDLFSSKVDKVFDREEKKRNRCSSSCYTGDRESPSRNNSWGSFDSAVVLPDRDAPSRQSSWGSCDTRLSGGSMLSRNSSFGAFDTKSSYGVSPFSADNSYQTSYVAFCIDKENLSSGRRIKPLTAKIVNIGNVGEEPKNEEYVTASRSVSNSKVYMPLPFKTQTESDDNKVDLINSGIGSSNFSSTNNTRELNITSPGTAISPVHPTHEFDTTDPLICSLKSPDNHELNTSDSCYRSGVKRGFKSSPQTPEHEIPLPGTVKQQMQKLECKTKQILRNDPNSVSCVKNNRTMEGSAQGIGRSLSSGCVCAANQPIPIPISRSSSEKRAKTDIEGSKGNVKKITKALENQYSERTFPSFEMSRFIQKKG
ncbi:Protein phosphatase Slingshot [Armadillidium vulgare]|nr:Protein phosphatase Slingshot [Armadillidium vulgare]